MAYHLRETSPHDALITAQVASWASRNLDPAVTANDSHDLRHVSEVAAANYKAAHNDEPLPERPVELFDHAFRNVADSLIEQQFFGANTLDDRLQLVTDPSMIIAISSLAHRNEEAMTNILHGHSEKPRLVRKSATEVALEGDTDRHMSDRYCPYAKDPIDEQQPHKVMAMFVPWAGQVAVHIVELYRK